MTAIEDRPEATGKVGDWTLRKEDARLITGQTRWTDNITLPGMLHAAVLRSPMAHARISRLDTSHALEQPGVVAAFTGADLEGEYGALPCAWPVTADMVNPAHMALAVEEVKYVGDAVAVVVARTSYQAADALEFVDVEYEPLDPVVDMLAAVEDGATKVHSDTDSNVSFLWPFEAGDVDAAFDGAHTVVSRRFVNQRLIPGAIEPRSVVVDPASASGEVTVYSATQVPHILRLMLALTLSIPEQKVRVIAPDVGGGFGSKLNVYAEEVAMTAIARRLGKPLKWTASRSEDIQATIHGRDQIQDIAIAADADGRIRGLKVDLLADMGAYLQLVTPGVPILGAFMFPSIYKMDAYHFACRGVFTTKTPTDAYRGAGRPEATFAIERIIDELAAELGMEPMELRKRNWIAHEEFPFDTIAGLTYDSGNYEAATEKAMELFGYDELREEQRQRRESGDPVQLGIGISTFTEMCGLAPSRVLGSLSYGAGGWEAATVRMLPTGKVEVVTGTSPHGQGHVTAWSQIAADTLGVPFDDVDVLHGDTKIAPMGLDTYGSRSLVVGGIALKRACDKVVQKAKVFAAHMLEASEDDLEFADGAYSVKGDPEKSTTIQDIALAVFAGHDYPEGVELDLTANMVFDPENFSFPHGTHLAAMEVDTETGRVTIRKYVCVDDIGNVVNPMIVEGQVHGGLAQGIAQAMWEGVEFDDAGNLLTGTFIDYTLPSAADMPSFVTDRTTTPATSNDLGVKGVGEAGTIASTPAIVNGAIDAVRHLGINELRMPLVPRTVWNALQAAKGEG
ncbi:Carbon monoxide dehydrogenase large chain [Euzebya pacifica]|uniref:Carbon monoxide dehydrogenase large chain n=1 Tax=Euzebya pacifica TaxID=1608957 RepID=A0A346XXX4_9ACTN|nr:xanthine dehydrogenase family protein molybdopterin-binding subunit [Euzebya pacifica]AXV07071.1 Carbon monoxide dehydrogenase large chain [Euzebya pacifica]